MTPQVLAIGLSLAAAPLRAQPVASVDDYQAAMAGDNVEEAARIVDRLIKERRPVDAGLRTDPLINALAGRLAVARGDAQSGSTYLRRAPVTALPESIRAETLFALAGAQELVGEWREAVATLGALDALKLDAAQARRLTYAKAHLALVTDPARAADLVRPAIAAASRPQDRWEGEFILGAARGLLGDTAGSQAAGDRAWMAAAYAPARQHAPYAAALLRAASAPDRDGTIAMLNIAGAAGHKIDPWLANLLPVCGAGVQPSDFVTFAIYKLASGEVAHTPLRASRPAAVAAFHTPLGGRNMLAANSSVPGGSLLTVRCRSLVSSNYDVAPPAIEPLLDWFVERGLYPTTLLDASVEGINAAAADLDKLTAQHGANSPRLLPLMNELGMRLTLRAASEQDVSKSRVNDLQIRARAIMRTAGATADLIPTEEEFAIARAVELSDDPARALAAKRRLVAGSIERTSLIVAYSAALNWFEQDSEAAPAEKRRVIERLLARFVDRPDDLRRRALLVRLAAIETADDKRPAALRALAAAGAERGICTMFDESAKLVDQPITSDDYPADLLRNSLEGFVAFEVDIASTGVTGATRLLFSSPGDLFNEITTRKLKDFRFSPAMRRGRAVACTRYSSKVTWKLPEDSDDEALDFFDADALPSS